MASPFPSNPSNGDTFDSYGRTYEYSSVKSAWHPVSRAPKLGELTDVDTTGIEVGQDLTYDDVNGEYIPGYGAVSRVVATMNDLPVVKNNFGDLTFVQSNNRLYMWRGSAWTSVALVNTSPTITVGPDGAYTLAMDGTPTVITLEAQDPEGIPITWGYAVASGSLEDTTVDVVGNEFTITPGTVNAAFDLTFTASDTVNIATAISSFTLKFVTSDQYYNQTSILLTTPGTSAGTTYDIVDNGPNNHQLSFISSTRNEYPFINSNGPHTPTHYSGNFLQASQAFSDTRLRLGTGDFTIEAWVHANYWQSNSYGWSGSILSNGYLEIRFSDGATNSGRATVYNTGSAISGMSTPVIAGFLAVQQWHHIALVRNSGTLTLYVNGTAACSTTFTTNLTQENFATSSLENICDLRIVKGAAVYTANFTPPTEPLTNIPGTLFLIYSQNNRDKFFSDISDNKMVQSNTTGTNAIGATPFAPFPAADKYDPAVHGGSLYMDHGQNASRINYVTRNLPGMGTGDYTLEFWLNRVQPNATQESAYVILESSAGQGIAVWTSFQQFRLSIKTAASSVLNQTIDANYYGLSSNPTYFRNFWDHIAIVRSSGTTIFYINGINCGSTTLSYDITGDLGISLNRSPNSTYGTGSFISDIRYVKGTAVYTSAFDTPTSVLTAIPGTELLLNFNNPKIINEQTYGVGGIGIVSDSVTKYSPTSMYFDGTNCLYFPPYQANYLANFQGGNFTIEAWVYLTSSLTTPQVIFAAYSNAISPGMRINNGNLELYTVGGTTVIASKALTGISLNEWFHCAIVKYNNSSRVYVNGYGGTAVTDNNRYTRTSQDARNMSVGAWLSTTEYSSTPSNPLIGYIEDLRVTRNIARYTSDFTPPTAALGWSNAE